MDSKYKKLVREIDLGFLDFSSCEQFNVTGIQDNSVVQAFCPSNSLASDEFINEPALPVETFKDCTGDILFIEMKERVSPLRGCPIAAINDQSIRLISAHANNSIGLSRIIQQMFLGSLEKQSQSQKR
uniref:Uncharacterized protein n=1 Tax=Romanomermis culicivorax TaxID=13658 RepID=A0A915KZ20_ROMCU